MKLLLILISLVSTPLLFQVRIPGPGGKVAVPYTCGNTVSTGTNNSFANLPLFTPCTTGSNAGGYTVTSVNIYVANAAGKVYSAIYTDSTSCLNSQSHCPSTVVCSDTTGVTAAANQFNTDTPSGCGTLAANTTFWIGQNADNAGKQSRSQAGNCPAPLAYTGDSNYVASMTAGTWSAASTTAIDRGGACDSAYMVLSPQ